MNRAAHGREMFRRRAAAAAHDPDSCAEQFSGEFRHLFRRRVVDNFAIPHVRRPSVRLDHDLGGSRVLRDLAREFDVIGQGKVGAAIRAHDIGPGIDGGADGYFDGGARHGSEGAAGGFLECVSGDDGNVGAAGFGGFDAEGGFCGIAHGFDEDGVGAALEQGDDLFREGGAEFRGGDVADRREKSAERPDIAEHPVGVAGGLARDAGGGAVEFRDAAGAAVGFECEARAAEGIGGDEVAAGLRVRGVNGGHIAGSVDIPEHAAVAAGEAAGEQLGAHGAVAAERPQGEFGNKVRT